MTTTGLIHESWPADDAAALQAVLTDCPPHLDPLAALWGASTALLRRRAGSPWNDAMSDSPTPGTLSASGDLEARDEQA